MIGLLPLVDLSVNEGRGDNSSGSFCWVAYVSVASVGLLFALDFHVIPACFVETTPRGSIAQSRPSASSKNASAIFLLVCCGCCRWFSGGSPSPPGGGGQASAAAGAFDDNDEGDEDGDEEEDDDERGRYDGRPRLFETDDSMDSGRKRYFGKVAEARRKKKRSGAAGNSRHLGSPLLAGAEDGGGEGPAGGE